MPPRMIPKEMPKIAQVKLPDDWEALISEGGPKLHWNARRWTAEEDDFLYRARKAGVEWLPICEKLKVCENTASKRLRELERARASN